MCVVPVLQGVGSTLTADAGAPLNEPARTIPNTAAWRKRPKYRPRSHSQIPSSPTLSPMVSAIAASFRRIPSPGSSGTVR